MWRTLRTKVSTHRLRKEQPAQAPPAASLLRRPLGTIRRAPPTPDALSPPWKHADLRHFSDEAQTPGLTPDASPSMSASTGLPTPVMAERPLQGEDSVGKPGSHALAQNLAPATVLIHQQADDQPQNASQAMLHDLWDPSMPDSAQPTPSFGLGLTLTDATSGTRFVFPSPTHMTSMQSQQPPHLPHEESGTLRQHTSSAMPSSELGVEHLVPPSTSAQSLATVDTQGSHGLSLDPPFGGASNVLLSLINKDFPSPPSRQQEMEKDKGISQTRPNVLDQRPILDKSSEGQHKSGGLSIAVPKLRPLELGLSLDDSSVAQRRLARLSAALPSPTLRTPLATESPSAFEDKPGILPLEMQSFKDRYPPSISPRRPALGPLPPTPASTRLAAARADVRPTHLSPHLTLEEAVQMSLDPSSPTSPTAPMARQPSRRASGIGYLRDGKPISGLGGAEAESRRVSILSNWRTTREGASSQSGRSTSPALTPATMSQAQKASTELARQSSIVSTAVRSPGTAETQTTSRPVHPPNMACIAGCCAPTSRANSTKGAFRSIGRASTIWSKASTAEESKFTRSPSTIGGFKVPEMPRLPSFGSLRQLKKVKSTPNLEEEYEKLPRASFATHGRPSIALDREPTPAMKRKQHQQRKGSSKSVGSLRFLARAFQKGTATDEPALPADISMVAVGHRTQKSRTTLRLSVDSDESWGPSSELLPLAQEQPKSFVAFQALPLPPTPAPIIPAMSLRRPSESSVRLAPPDLSKPEALSAQNPAKDGVDSATLRFSTVASAMFGTDSLASIASPTRELEDPTPVTAAPRQLHDGYRFPSSAPVVAAAPTSVPRTIYAVGTTLKNDSGSSNLHNELEMASVRSSVDSSSSAASSASSRGAYAFDSSQDDRTRALSWDSSAFSLERQMERLRELESPQYSSDRRGSGESKAEMESGVAGPQAGPMSVLEASPSVRQVKDELPTKPSATFWSQTSLYKLATAAPPFTDAPPPFAPPASAEQDGNDVVVPSSLLSEFPMPSGAGIAITTAHQYANVHSEAQAAVHKLGAPLPLVLPRLEIEEGPLFADTMFAF